MNNKGQTFLLFVLLIPIFIMCFAYIFDTSLIVYEKNNLKDTAVMAKEYLNSGISYDEVSNYILKNDNDVVIKELNSDKVNLYKVIPSYFGNIIGYKNYNIEINI